MPGSLPRLRIGRRYWIRARIVDLAGNSLLPQLDDFGPENPLANARLYCRYEPLAAPVIALVKPPDAPTEKPMEGESVERIAIRSFNNTPESNSLKTHQQAWRFVVPPQSSVRDAEIHGKLDVGGKIDKTKFDLLANQKDWDAKDLKHSSLQEEKIPTSGPLGSTVDDTTYAVYREGKPLTYLPDPIAEEVAVRIFDHPNISDTNLITIPLYPTSVWPDAQPFKILVYDHPTARPSYDEGTHTLVVPLPKAICAKIRLSMRLSEKWLDRMGIWNWLSTEDKVKLKNMALDGEHWMLTPWCTVDVVHAVQRPLVSPKITRISINVREYGATSARPTFIAVCSLKSTDHLDLVAEWHEPQDNLAEKIPLDSKGNEVAFTIKINDAKTYSTRMVDDKFGGFAEYMVIDEDVISVNTIMTVSDLTTQKSHELRDTRYRRIEYWLEGTTKFREYMPAIVLDSEPTDKNIKVIGPRAVTWIPSSSRPPAPEVLYLVPYIQMDENQGR